jgi:hypothetical protein
MHFCVYKVAFRLIDIKHDFASHGVKTSFEMCKTSFSNAGLWSASSKITSNGSFCSGLWGFVSFGCTVSSLLSQTLTLPHPPNLPVDKRCLRPRRLLVALNRTFVWPTSVDVRHRSTIPLQYTNPFLHPPIIVGTISPTSHNTHCHGPDTTTSIVRRTLESRAIWTALRENRALAEFSADQISPLAQHYKVHEQLREFLTQRVRTEGGLEDMLSDRAAGGLPLDPNRDYEDKYRRLSQQYDDLNKAMCTVYATFLDTTPRTSRKIAPPSLLVLLLLPR